MFLRRYPSVVNVDNGAEEEDNDNEDGESEVEEDSDFEDEQDGPSTLECSTCQCKNCVMVKVSRNCHELINTHTHTFYFCSLQEWCGINGNPRTS
jgi:hypothetical protein